MPCSQSALSINSREAIEDTNTAGPIIGIKHRRWASSRAKSRMARISSRARPGTRTSSPWPSSRTRRLGIGARGDVDGANAVKGTDAVGFGAGAGAGASVATAGTGVAVSGVMTTYSAPGEEGAGPFSTAEAGKSAVPVAGTSCSRASRSPSPSQRPSSSNNHGRDCTGCSRSITAVLGDRSSAAREHSGRPAGKMTATAMVDALRRTPCSGKVFRCWPPSRSG